MASRRLNQLSRLTIERCFLREKMKRYQSCIMQLLLRSILWTFLIVVGVLGRKSSRSVTFQTVSSYNTFGRDGHLVLLFLTFIQNAKSSYKLVIRGRVLRCCSMIAVYIHYVRSFMSFIVSRIRNTESN